MMGYYRSMPSLKTPSTPCVRNIEVELDGAGQRVDNYLLKVLKGVPKSRIYRLLRTGEVRVNGGRAKPDRRLEAGDRLRLPPIRQAEPPAVPSLPPGLAARIEDAVLVEDAHLLVIDKPAGIPVHGGSGVRHGLIEALRQMRPNAPFLELGHRIDRETSGCLVVAKSRPALTAFHEALREGRVGKRYLALLAGDWRGGPRRVDAALVRTDAGGGRGSVSVDEEEGRHAESLFRPIERLPGAVLAEVEIGTGRTHQIRVHAAHIGHPVAGDRRYGDFEFNRRFGLKRLCLHAHVLEFDLCGRHYAVKAPWPADLEAVLRRLGK